jgi:hypothetical protein
MENPIQVAIQQIWNYLPIGQKVLVDIIQSIDTDASSDISKNGVKMCISVCCGYNSMSSKLFKKAGSIELFLAKIKCEIYCSYTGKNCDFYQSTRGNI